MRVFPGDPIVAEFQGLYGAFSFPERLLQKIWLRGDFDRSAAVLADGRRLHIGHPGRWNLLGGPDFIGARLRFGAGAEKEVIGDVEVHLRVGDWEAHGHAQDAAYDRVVLHVVLLPPPDGHTTRGTGGREIPVLALLPLLHRGLEEFAGDDAVEALADRVESRALEELGELPREGLAALVQRHAEMRWRQKVHFARLRVQRLGWESACHHAALEVLGFRRNRAPMLRLAGEFPLARWAAGEVEPDELYAHEREHWDLQGVRPANHPHERLRQYRAWVAARPDWPERLQNLAKETVAVAAVGETRDVRRRAGFAAWRERLNEAVCGRVLSGTRFDSFVSDALWPLLAAASGCPVYGWWYHWFPGDLPRHLVVDLQRLGVCGGAAHPLCVGAAQGLLGWLLEQESGG